MVPAHICAMGDRSKPDADAIACARIPLSELDGHICAIEWPIRSAHEHCSIESFPCEHRKKLQCHMEGTFLQVFSCWVQ